MVKVIDEKALDSLYDKINHCLYLTSDKTVIKNCYESCNNPDLIPERLEYVSSLPIIPGYTRPLNLISNGNKVYGYEMEYLEGYKTLFSYINNNLAEIDFSCKKKICLDLFKTIEELNKYYYVGDVNLNNIMVNAYDKSASIIDWENGTPRDFNYGILCSYAIKDINSIRLQDAFKMFISTISFLYGINFELIFPYMNMDEILEFCKHNKIDSSILAYLDDINSMILSGSKETIYFSQYLPYMKSISKHRVSSVKKKILSSKEKKDLY